MTDLAADKNEIHRLAGLCLETFTEIEYELSNLWLALKGAPWDANAPERVSFEQEKFVSNRIKMIRGLLSERGFLEPEEFQKLSDDLDQSKDDRNEVAHFRVVSINGEGFALAPFFRISSVYTEDGDFRLRGPRALKKRIERFKALAERVRQTALRLKTHSLDD